ncbi:hypothetical protein [Legionella micdadei]|uniref:Restriction endonuclease type II EcoRII C-terminal domain-containing protein n=1 Tax=Legionella micdadei TaxID=451 RepID=A0A098GDP0_LEGMI|nr:hypothetical protein [Legionella micdadei]ARG98239.1 hypothetical protein B6N58_11550 [Legionella micdadei]KTD29877.1 hypothetical protein Lmic_0482 [Legionella micdadei]CEG60097.1 protein of unknown function [Legionella micdadei]SCY79059.1 hypothetical protein SAMN02982997_02923 [Legionella micdadei]
MKQSDQVHDIALLNTKLIQNPWSNTYWFARMLLNSDKYAGIGRDTKRISQIGTEIITIINSNYTEPDTVLVPIILSYIKKSFLLGRKEGTKVIASIENFVSDIEKHIFSKIDAYVFAYTCIKIVALSNIALEAVPSDDKEYTQEFGRSILETQGANGLKILINSWDDLGVRGCLEAERTQVVNVFQLIKRDLQSVNSIDDNGIDLTLTAYVQEMERRLGQKRKGRGGRSLEDVTSLILNHFGFVSCPAPSHFQADIEVDTWLRTERKFYIGISCKRTLRERWKQVSSADSSNMGRYKIACFLHVITYSKDLSDDKLSLLGGYGHVFYLPDDDPTLLRHSQHSILSKYVRPMSEFINDLTKMIKNN